MATVSDRTVRRTAKVRRTSGAPPAARARLSVFRSSKHIYAQVIDDVKGETVAAASSLEKDMRGSLKTGANIDGRQGGRQARRRAGICEGRQGRRVRPRRLSLSRTRQGAGGRRARGRSQLLTGLTEHGRTE